PSLLAQDPAQIRALDQLHHEVEPPLVLAGDDRPDDVGMVEARGDLGLAQEALAEALVVAVEQLERDDLAGRLAACAVDLGHGASAEQLLDVESGDGLRHHPNLNVCTTRSYPASRASPRTSSISIARVPLL